MTRCLSIFLEDDSDSNVSDCERNHTFVWMDLLWYLLIEEMLFNKCKNKCVKLVFKKIISQLLEHYLLKSRKKRWRVNNCW